MINVEDLFIILPGLRDATDTDSGVATDDGTFGMLIDEKLSKREKNCTDYQIEIYTDNSAHYATVTNHEDDRIYFEPFAPQKIIKGYSYRIRETYKHDIEIALQLIKIATNKLIKNFNYEDFRIPHVYKTLAFVCATKCKAENDQWHIFNNEFNQLYKKSLNESIEKSKG